MSQVRRQSAVLPRPNWGWQDAAACKTAAEDGIIIGGHAAACATVTRTGEPRRGRQPFGMVTT